LVVKQQIRNRMAIDTKSLSQLITEFRAIQAKDAVSPESLGCILQRIVDLLSTAGTSETVTMIQTLLDGFKAAGQAITAISQGQSDRNHIYVNNDVVRQIKAQLTAYLQKGSPISEPRLYTTIC